MRRSEAALEMERAKVVRTAAFWAGGGSLLMGDGITDDTLFHITRFLPTARDLLCLCITCPHFAAKIIATVSADAQGVRQRRRCCRSWRRRGGRGWQRAMSRSVVGWRGARVRAGCV